MVVSMHTEKTLEKMAFLQSERKYSCHQIVNIGGFFTEKKIEQISRTKYMYYPLI